MKKTDFLTYFRFFIQKEFDSDIPDSISMKISSAQFYLVKYEVDDLETDYKIINKLIRDGKNIAESFDIPVHANPIEAIEITLIHKKEYNISYAVKEPPVYFAILSLFHTCNLLNFLSEEKEKQAIQHVDSAFLISHALIAARNWSLKTPAIRNAISGEKRASGKRGVEKRDAEKKKIIDRFIHSRMHGELKLYKTDQKALWVFIDGMSKEEKNGVRPLKDGEDIKTIDIEGKILRSLKEALGRYRKVHNT